MRAHTEGMRCVREGCHHVGSKLRDSGWFCGFHDQQIREREEATKHRANMVQGYMQSIYVEYVAQGAALDMDEAAARKHLRWLKEQARMAAEVLFEEDES